MIVLQHNCAGVGQVVVAAMEIGAEIGADLILLQEEKRGKDRMRSHGAFRWIGDERRRTRAAVRVTSNIEVNDQSAIAGPEAATDIQVLDIRMGSGEMIRVVNVYDQARSRKDRTRPCQQADWKCIMDFLVVNSGGRHE